MLLSLYQIFIFLLGHLHFFLHFFFTFMENLFKKPPLFYLGITVIQYNSQNGVVPMGPKQPGPPVFSFSVSLVDSKATRNHK